MEAQEIQALQGTRLSSKAPWETYSEEMGDSKLSPELQEQIARYEERRHVKASQEAEEELARQKELNWALSGDYRWLQPEEYDEIVPRIGKIMHSDVFLAKLRECGFEGWYAEHIMKGRLKLINSKGFGMSEGTYVCWLQEGYMSEFSIMRFDEHGVPLDERLRGYRTVLMQILLKKVLTEDQINRVFGRATGPASERYNSLFYEFRNKRIKAKEE